MVAELSTSVNQVHQEVQRLILKEGAQASDATAVAVTKTSEKAEPNQSQLAILRNVARRLTVGSGYYANPSGKHPVGTCAWGHRSNRETVLAAFERESNKFAAGFMAHLTSTCSPPCKKKDVCYDFL